MTFFLGLLFYALLVIGLLLATGYRIAELPNFWPAEKDEQPGRLPRPRPTTKQLIAGALCLIVGIGGFIYTRSANTNSIIDRAAVSCPQADTLKNYCVPELEKELGVNTEETIQEAERTITILNDEQTRAFTNLACTTPTKELHLTASLAVSRNPTPADMWRNYATDSTTKNGTRYIVLPEDYSPENFQQAANDYYPGMYDYTVQWASPEGGWVTNESSTSWDALLENRMRSWSDAKDLTLAPGLTQTISCEGK